MSSKRYALYIAVISIWVFFWLWASKELVARNSPISEYDRSLILFGVGAFFGTLTTSLIFYRGRKPTREE